MRRLAAAMLAVALLTAGCGIGGRDELTVYSGRSRDLVEPLLNAFADDTGISVAVKYADSTELALLLGQEGDRSPADVFFSQSPGTMGHVDAQGLLGELPESTLERVAARYRSGDGRWVGITARQRVLVYNSDLVEEADLPKSVLDLTDPSYRGRVAVAPSNASFQDFITALRSAIGDDGALEWLRGMAENDSPVYENNNAIVEAVGRGEVPMGLVNHYYNERFLAEDPNLPSSNASFEAGDLGNIVVETSAAVLESTDQAEEAQRFIDYLLSEKSQQYFARETFEYPLAAGVEPAADLPPLDAASPPPVHYDELGSGFERTHQLIEQSGIAD